ncbi:MAG: DegQ family serine endoprotease [Pseudomonadota bacterium]
MSIIGITTFRAAALAATLVFGFAPAAPVAARAAPDSFADLAADLLPKVVNISTSQTIEGRGFEMPQLPPGSPFEDFFKEFFDRNPGAQPQQRPRRATSLGSGFIVDPAGFVVTNNHVIQDADEITVVLHDGTRLKAEVVGRDAKTDIAVLKVAPTTKLSATKFGNSDKARVGDWVIAIGNPFGLGGSVTAGIVSARGRDINAGPYDDFIQTDASINRGNSGGPLFNLEGEVIGINAAIFSPSGGSVGIGFSIPTATAEPVIRQLIKGGEVKRGWLGVHIQAVTDEIAETLGMKSATGALVASVIKGGPAEKSGLQAGDVVLKFDGREVGEMRRLPRLVADTEVGKKVPVVVWRNGRETKLDVTVGQLEEEAKVAARGDKKGGKKGGNGNGVVVGDLGLTVTEANPRARERFKIEKEVKGVIVIAVEEEGPSAEKGIRPGDVIVEVGQQEVTKPADIVARIRDAKKAGRKSVLLLVEGQGGLRFVAVRLGKG